KRTLANSVFNLVVRGAKSFAPSSADIVRYLFRQPGNVVSQCPQIMLDILSVVMEGDFSSSAIVMGKLLRAEAFSERCARKEGSDAESFFFPPGAPRGREACLCRSSGHRLTALTWS